MGKSWTAGRSAYRPLNDVSNRMGRPLRATNRAIALLLATALAGVTVLGGARGDKLGPSSVPPHVRLSGDRAALTLAGPASSAPEMAAGSDKDWPCTQIKRSTLKAIFKVRVGAFYNEGEGACSFGLSSNSHLKGLAVEEAESDTMLAQLFPADGPAQYKYYNNSKNGMGKTFPLHVRGYKATYQFGPPFSIYVLKGSQFCLVDLNLNSGAEVGAPASPDGSIAASAAPGVAKHVLAICGDFYS
jgi:hypothetical protein